MKAPHYTEIRVRRFWLLPKVRIGFQFDMFAWYLLYYENGLQLQEISKLKQDELFETMLYFSAVSWSRHRGKRVWFTQDDLTRWADNLTRKDFERITKTFMESFMELSKAKDETEEGTKKK